jgi:hypothetical protein
VPDPRDLKKSRKNAVAIEQEESNALSKVLERKEGRKNGR